MNMTKIKKSIGLTTEPLDILLEKKEVIDIRLNEPMWADLQVGDFIEFVEDPSEARRIKVEILGLPTYRSFEDLYDANESYFAETKDELLTHLYRWWTKDEEKKYGVLGIKVRLIK